MPENKTGPIQILQSTISNFDIFLILKIQVHSFVHWGVFTVHIDAYPNLALKYNKFVLMSFKLYLAIVVTMQKYLINFVDVSYFL